MQYKFIKINKCRLFEASVRVVIYPQIPFRSELNASFNFAKQRPPIIFQPNQLNPSFIFFSPSLPQASLGVAAFFLSNSILEFQSSTVQTTQDTSRWVHALSMVYVG